MLIATLCSIQREDLMEAIISHPLIDGVRYNVGAISPYTPKETLKKISDLTTRYGKRLWIDLKGRQLRVNQWSHRMNGRVVLNHEIQVDLPAHIHFRGDGKCDIKFVRGNQIWIDPPTRFFTGEGQSVNVHGENLVVHGYLTEMDKEYIRAAVDCDISIFDFMCSFIECEEDILEIENEIEAWRCLPINPKLVLKIESQRGMEFIERFVLSQQSGNYTLMAARDDLMINIGENKAMILHAVKQIALKDSNAIVASRIFSGLESGQEVSMGDWADLVLMRAMGYTSFMFSDEICNYNFDAAMKAWQNFNDAYPFTI